MLLYKKDQITDDENIIILGKKDSDFSPWFKNKNELDYLKKRTEEDKKTLTFNHLNRIVLVQILGNQDKAYYIRLEEARKAACSLHRQLKGFDADKVCIVNGGITDEEVYAFAEGLALTNYQFNRYFTKNNLKEKTLTGIGILSEKVSEENINRLNIIVTAVSKARDLVNEPLSYLTAVQLAAEIEKMGKESGFKTEVLNKRKIESLKMGGLLAVNRGSIDPPTFTIMEWKPENAVNEKPLVLVGKGIVYDTGGLSLKPTPDSMDYMKCDMAGAAAVAGTLYAVAASGLPVWVIGLAPATDNRPDGNAYVPGDVVTMYDGTTVEVLNTDAEGRMILADALSYAKQYDPELVIELSTLTGSAHAAIGQYGIVGMGNAGREVFDQLKMSGEHCYERIVEFPFWDEYGELLKSDIADLKNIGGKYAGAITAGKFLENFTSYPYIHLDIAGPSYNKTTEEYRGKGGSGVGVRLLYDFLLNHTR
ncbi:MAG: leucyl aminopeptidase family protein [Bacteroidota bacterium]